MTLGIVEHGLGVTPAQLIQQARGIPMSRAGVEERLRQEAQQLGIPTSRAELEQRLVQEAERRGISTSPRAIQKQVEQRLKKEGERLGKKIGQEIGVDQAQKLFKDELSKIGVPTNIPFQIPTEPTAEGVAIAAYGTGKNYIENLLSKEIGFPVRLPSKLTWDEIEKSITGLLPTDVEEAIDLGLALGTQYAASAVTSLLAGAGVGSIIPGLGTVVGIAMALAVEALKDALKEKPPPFARQCQTRVQCPRPPEVDSLQVLVWVSQERSLRFMPALSQERRKRYCGRGEIITCMSFLALLGRQAYELSRTTPQVLGLYQLDRYIPQYASAPTTGPVLDPKRRVIKTITTRAGQDITTLLAAMRKRQVKLQALVVKANQIERLSPRDIASLRFTLVTELKNAAMQFQNQQNVETERWLATLASYMHRLLKHGEQVAAQRRATVQQKQRRFEQARKDPAKVREFELQQLQFKCGQGDERACAAYRKLAATPVGRRRVVTQRGPLTEAQVGTMTRDMINAWIAKNPRQARCITPRSRQVITRLMVAAHVKRSITIPAAMKRIMGILTLPC